MIHTNVEQINLALQGCFIIGVIACSISGTFIAISSRMDITGAILLAFIKSYGGGIVRDLMLNSEPLWIKDYRYAILSIVTAIITYLICYWNKQFLTSKKIYNLLIFFDAIGLGVFCIFGMEKVTSTLGNNYVIAIIMGLWTPIGGGVLADMLANRLPMVFSSELYITVALLGAFLYIGLGFIITPELAAIVSVITMIIVRMLSVKYHWHLPIIKNI